MSLNAKNKPMVGMGNTKNPSLKGVGALMKMTAEKTASVNQEDEASTEATRPSKSTGTEKIKPMAASPDIKQTNTTAEPQKPSSDNSSVRTVPDREPLQASVTPVMSENKSVKNKPAETEATGSSLSSNTPEKETETPISNLLPRKKAPKRPKKSAYTGVTVSPNSIGTNAYLTIENSEYLSRRSNREKIGVSELVNVMLKAEQNRITGKKRSQITINRDTFERAMLTKSKVTRRVSYDQEIYDFLQKASMFFEMKATDYLNYVIARERFKYEKELSQEEEEDVFS